MDDPDLCGLYAIRGIWLLEISVAADVVLTILANNSWLDPLSL
jgi:hypothetical protein